MRRYKLKRNHIHRERERGGIEIGYNKQKLGESNVSDVTNGLNKITLKVFIGFKK